MKIPQMLTKIQLPRFYTLGLICNVGLVFCAGMGGYCIWGAATEYERSLHKPKVISEFDIKLMVKTYNDCKAERVWRMQLKDATGIQYEVVCSEDLRFAKP